MNERVMEILNLVLQKIFTDEKKYDEQELVENLLEKGYALSEIDAAFELIFSVPEMFKSTKEKGIGEKQQGFRVFSYLEQVKLPVQIQEQVLRFYNRGLLLESEMEMLFMEAMLADIPEISFKELNMILVKVVKDETRLMMMISPGVIGEKYEVN